MIFELQNMSCSRVSEEEDENVREEEDEFSTEAILVTQDEHIQQASNYTSETQKNSKNSEGLKLDAWIFKTFDKKGGEAKKKLEKQKPKEMKCGGEKKTVERRNKEDRKSMKKMTSPLKKNFQKIDISQPETSQGSFISAEEKKQ